MINITLPDGSVRQYDKGITSMQIAQSISEGLARNVLAAEVDGQVWDASRPIEKDAHVKLLTWNDTKVNQPFWHSSAHLMAEALEALYPGTKFGIGPAIETGFYYDVDFGDKVLSSDEFKQIEDKMIELAKTKAEYIRKPVSKADAIEYFTEKDDEYKLDLIKDLPMAKLLFIHKVTLPTCAAGLISQTPAL
jgi:threonyl-tRNA synthetase